MTLHIRRGLWNEVTSELHRRTEGVHESGAFLLGKRNGDARTVHAVVYYDELDPGAYDSGVCVLHAEAFSGLWDRCSASGLSVVADIHVHPYGAGQSPSDRENPMIARAGHVAIILPRMAKPPIRRWAVGVYEYEGAHRWRSFGGCRGKMLRIEE
jgi:hypothetical protein